jgi:hypothetical protein
VQRGRGLNALAKAASAQAATQSPKANSKGASPRGSHSSPGSAPPPEPAAGSSSPSGGACSFGTPSPATGSSTATPPPLPLCTPKKRRHPGEHGSPPPPQLPAKAPGPRPAAEAPGTCGGQAGDGGGSPRRAGGRARGREGPVRGRGLRAPCRAAPPACSRSPKPGGARRGRANPRGKMRAAVGDQSGGQGENPEAPAEAEGATAAAGAAGQQQAEPPASKRTRKTGKQQAGLPPMCRLSTDPWCVPMAHATARVTTACRRHPMSESGHAGLHRRASKVRLHTRTGTHMKTPMRSHRHPHKRAHKRNSSGGSTPAWHGTQRASSSSMGEGRAAAESLQAHTLAHANRLPQRGGSAGHLASSGMIVMQSHRRPLGNQAPHRQAETVGASASPLPAKVEQPSKAHRLSRHPGWRASPVQGATFRIRTALCGVSVL